jgi:hypothetical protein
MHVAQKFIAGAIEMGSLVAFVSMVWIWAAIAAAPGV